MPRGLRTYDTILHTSVPVPQQNENALHIKVGGVTRAEDAQLAASLGAWAVGVCLARKDPRFVNADTARKIFAALPAGVLKVGQFRNQSPEVVRRVADEVGLDLVELAGHETDEVVQAIGGERVIKTVVIHEAIGIATVLGYHAAYLQLEKAYLGAPTPTETVDLRIAAGLTERFLQTIIGGTLTAQDVAEVVRTTKPWGLDASRAVEHHGDPTHKDADAMRAFFAATALGKA